MTDRLFDGATAAGRLMAATDWTATPVGDPATWPEALRGQVRTVLSSRSLGMVTADTPMTSAAGRTIGMVTADTPACRDVVVPLVRDVAGPAGGRPLPQRCVTVPGRGA